MKLHVLGTAGYHPNEERHTACLMLPAAGVILDAGTGIFRAGELLRTKTLDIFLTHAHLDHIVGLTYLLDVLHDKKMEGVFVHGEAVKLEAVRSCLFSEHLFPVEPPFVDRPMELGETVSLNSGARVSNFRLQHPGKSVAYRLDWPDRSMAYVTDTTAAPDADYVEFIRGVDLLVHECNFGDALADYAVTTGHSHTTPVATVAAKAGVKSLVLVHFNPLSPGLPAADLAAAREIFPAVRLAADQDVIEF